MAVTVRTPDSGFESLEQRSESLSRIIPYLLLAIPLIPYALSQRPTAGAFGITVGIAAAAGAWVRQPAREPLSRRELDILGLIAQGCSNREAAARLFISEATVKTHVLHIYAKLAVNDRAAAVAVGFERGLLPRP